MSQVDARTFNCEVYRTDGIDAYSATAELYTATTAAFLVNRDGRVRQLTIGEDAAVHEITADVDPIREDELRLLKFDNAFYTTNDDIEDVTLGTHYLVDDDTVITVTSKTNNVTAQPPIDEISEEEIRSEHEDLYVVQRHSPFGRFRYRTNRVRRFLKSDRVAELVPVASR